MYLFSVSYLSRSDGSRAVPRWPQVAALTTGLASIMLTLCYVRWSLRRFGPHDLAHVLGENVSLRM